MPNIGRGIAAGRNIQARRIIDISPVLVMPFEELDAVKFNHPKSLHIVSMVLCLYVACSVKLNILATGLLTSRTVTRHSRPKR